LRQPRILIIEPTRSFQRLVASVVSDAGAQGVVASDAAEGMHFLEAGKFDAICAAATLPDANVIEFVKRVRAWPTARETPIIVLTASGDESFVSDALKAGVTEVFGRGDIHAFARHIRDLARSAGTALSGRVLLLEDSAAIALGIVRILSKAGLAVRDFRAGGDAIAAFDADDFDLVVTDVVLDNSMSGIVFVRELRGKKGMRGARVPILAISGLDDSARRIEILRAGASDFLNKPIVPEEFVARVGNLIGQKRLLDQIETQHAELRALALTDQLTTLYNRHFLLEVAQMTLSDARRHRYPVSMVVVDIDHFKTVNDTYGHAVGDRVIAAVAGAIKAACRREDVAARLGGEEFVLLLPRCALDQALAKSECLRGEIAALRVSGHAVTASFGVATSEDAEIADFDALFALADAAMYRAKRDGRNRVCSGRAGAQSAAAPAFASGS